MLRLAALLILICATTAAWAAADTPQRLSIDITARQPRVERLDTYTVGQGVAIRVTAPAVQRVTIVGMAPDGSSVRVPLTAGTDGVYAGTLAVANAGTWSLAADATIAGNETMTETFPIVVVPAPPRDDATPFVALAAASICGGIGLIAIGRATAVRSVN